MTIGIYRIYWVDSKVYIGQSANIERRYSSHLNDLINGEHHSIKLQQEFLERSGTIPQMSVLEVCDITSLDTLERFYIKKYNSSSRGFNMNDGGAGVGRGTTSSASKYSKWQILKVFALLLKGTLSRKEIALKTGVSEGTIKHIRQGDRHLWISEEYPEKFKELSNRPQINGKPTLQQRGKPLAAFILPDGSIVENITSIAEFALTQSSLPTGARHNLAAIWRGVGISYKGYRAYRKK